MIDAKIAKDDARQSRETPPSRRRLLAGVALAAVLTGAAGLGWHHWTVGRFVQETDDAYVQADNVVVSPKVAGYVAEVLVGDNQPVTAGQVLARIDDRDYQAALHQAEADVATAQAAIADLDAKARLQQATIAQADADLVAAEAAVVYSRQDQARYQALLASGYGTVQKAQLTESDARQKAAQRLRAQASLDSARRQLDVLGADKTKAQAELARAQANLERAQLDLSHTALVAPVDGVVGDRALRLGQYVQPGSQVMTVVPMGGGLYVVANFKETQIERMLKGEAAELTVDAFPDHPLQGRIDSLAPGSGAQFSLLPPENATGNFTKIVQRVPVKIMLDGADPLVARLRPGLSVTASVDTRPDAVAAPQHLAPQHLAESGR